MCHLKTKEYIRGVLSALGPLNEGARVCVDCVSLHACVCEMHTYECVCVRVKVEGRHYKQVMSETPLTLVFSSRYLFK